MRATCPRSPLVGTGWLEGWRLTFAGRELGWESAVATAVEDRAERLFVALYDVESTVDAVTLDDLEGVTGGMYRRMHTTAATLEGNVPVWMYVYDGYEGGLPSAWYLAELASAAEQAGAPQDYVAALRKRPTSPGLSQVPSPAIRDESRDRENSDAARRCGRQRGVHHDAHATGDGFLVHIEGPLV